MNIRREENLDMLNRIDSLEKEMERLESFEFRLDTLVAATKVLQSK